jgi:four helix bundle protein
MRGETMAVKYFEDFQIWQEARRLTNKIYDATRKQAFSRDFGLCDQIRRASVSVMSNIAEGYERGGNQEFLQFLSIAKGSCGEVRCQLYVTLDQGYLERNQCEAIIDQFKKLSIMISNFMRYIKGTPYKGTKYKPLPQKSVKEEIEELMKDTVSTV